MDFNLLVVWNLGVFWNNVFHETRQTQYWAKELKVLKNQYETSFLSNIYCTSLKWCYQESVEETLKSG